MDKKKIMLFALGICLVLSTNGFASTMIDFRGPAFSGSFGQPSFNFTHPGDGLVLGFVAQPVDPATKLWWDNLDGIGIQSPFGYEPDEIEAAEVLQLNLSFPIFLDQIHITDLFSEHGYLEIGRIQVDTGTPIIVQGVQILGSSNGDLWVPVGMRANFIRFTAPGQAFAGENHEFSVAGIDYSPAPVPPAVLLFGSGLLGLVGLRRRMRA